MTKRFSGLWFALIVCVVGMVSPSAVFAQGVTRTCPYGTTHQCAAWMPWDWQVMNGTTIYGGVSHWEYTGNVAGAQRTVKLQVLKSSMQAEVTLNGIYYGAFPTQLISATTYTYTSGSFYGELAASMVFNVVVDGTSYKVTMKILKSGFSTNGPLPMTHCFEIDNLGICGGTY
ncbi:MAG: hypothetical protein V4858_18015 [Pseudomonadota bacterium]